MGRRTLVRLAHSEHPIAAPLSDARVDDMLTRTTRGRRRVLDLGCGDGTWLLRALRHDPGLTAVGVDTSDVGFEKTMREAALVGLADRLTLVQGDVRRFMADAPFDAVLSVGAAYAYGGLEPTLEAARGHLAADGLLLLGDCFWPVPPTAAVLEGLGGASPDEYLTLPDTVDLVTRHGWVTVYGHVSTQEEWDDYEWSWTGAPARWAVENPDHPEAGEVLAAVEAHRDGWLRGYRGGLGFVTLVLHPGRAAVAAR
ncbi:methyltransferase family protein [Sediminihabitans luteus]|uniref:Methyltransferase family protein n=1 Tax=Sediminihabitans luteus TaxID=1138585 RepID=A0A2M9CQW5_9CELL|nr:class I SAM-dependent methyltransferase [Sediminihabitans luteus]PJJ74330.1 methyltransferase family protein [Sediminihabitans luteus]GIJ00442.1 SAM-dependent methyltransferase [Sediminihabitans luteus]